MLWAQMSSIYSWVLDYLGYSTAFSHHQMMATRWASLFLIAHPLESLLGFPDVSSLPRMTNMSFCAINLIRFICPHMFIMGSKLLRSMVSSFRLYFYSCFCLASLWCCWFGTFDFTRDMPISSSYFTVYSWYGHLCGSANHLPCSQVLGDTATGDA